MLNKSAVSAAGRFICCLLLLASLSLFSAQAQKIVVAADRSELYLPKLKGKRVGVLVNQTSVAQGQNLVDFLQAEKIDLRKIFVPEHGFRGTEDAGANIADGKDERSGLPMVSLHGKNKKPTEEQLRDIDILVYDLQDVGLRFYTYISTLQYAMEACAQYGKEILVLDRPNPNAHFVGGPVLDTAYRSFVGMQAVPTVYGMTAGEYALMLRGERLFAFADRLKLEVIPCGNYKHRDAYSLPVAPSPNLRDDEAIALYPATCFFEGTVLSLGRGTDMPFKVWGHPAYAGIYQFSFTPKSIAGASNPPLLQKTCYGKRCTAPDRQTVHHLDLSELVEAYQNFPDKPHFFTDFFEKLAGNATLRKQIESGMSAQAIAKTWEEDIARFKKIRARYLLYKD